MWGNAQYGDCVTAEEAFARACNNPEIFITDAEAVSWANKHGFANKMVLPDTSPASPALAVNGSTLYLAWKGDSNDNLNVEVSPNAGASFGNKLVFGETSPEPPSLAFLNGSLFMAWKGDSNDQLSVAKVTI